MNETKSLWMCLLVCINFSAIGQQRIGEEVLPFTIKQDVKNASSGYGFSEYHLLDLHDSVLQKILAEKPQQLTVRVPLTMTTSVNVELERSEIFGKILPAHEMTETGLREFNYTPGVYYHGKMAGDEKSRASFSFFQNEVVAILSNAKGNFVLGNVRDKAGNPLPGQCVLYNDRDMSLPFTFECHSEDILQVKPKVPKGENLEKSAGICQVEEIYFECDYAMFLDHGSNTTNVLNYITGVFNEVAAIYDIHDLKVAIHSATVWTTDDPYSTSSSQTALGQFQDTQVQEADFHHLLSTNDNNLGGIAYVGDNLCNDPLGSDYYNYAYSDISNSYNEFPLFSWSVMVIAHENGHNLGSHHTHWCGWPTGRLDNCGPTAGYNDNGSCAEGPTPADGTLMSYCHLISGIGIDLTLGFGTWPVYGPTNAVTEEISSNTCFANPVLGSLTASGNGTVCQGNNITLTATSISNANVEWFGPNGYYSESPTSVITNANPSQSGVYKAVASYVGCSTDTIYVNITVSPQYNAPTLVTATPAAILAGQSSGLAVVSGTLQSGASWKWYSSQCGGVVMGQGSTLNVSPTATTTYYVRAEGSCPSSVCAPIALEVFTDVETCTGDVNGNGSVETSDLLLFLTDMGCSGPCVGDFTDDGVVNTSDLLLLLSVFGQDCI